MNQNETNENTQRLIKIPWYLSIWFIIAVFAVSFASAYGMPGIILAIIRFVKYKEKRVGSAMLVILAFVAIYLSDTDKGGNYEKAQEGTETEATVGSADIGEQESTLREDDAQGKAEGQGDGSSDSNVHVQETAEQDFSEWENAPYLSEGYLYYYLWKNKLDACVFKEYSEWLEAMDSVSGDVVSIEEKKGLFGAPYYAMTRYGTDGLFYRGQMKDNKPDGVGIAYRAVGVFIDEEQEMVSVNEYVDGESNYVLKVYAGNFREGRPEGYGIEYYGMDDWDYVPIPRDIDLKELQRGMDEIQEVIFEAANPRKYEGYFENGEYAGMGNEYMYPALYLSHVKEMQDSISGNAEDSEEDGWGDYEENSEQGGDSGNLIDEALRENGKDILIYSGNYEKGEKNGQFKCYNGGYLSYDGEMKNGEQNGKGTMYYSHSNQIQYEGEWSYGKYNGEGTLYDENGGVIYSGTWDRGDYAH